MHPSHPALLHQPLQIVGDLISNIKRTVLPRLVANLQHLQNLTLIHALHLPRYLREPLVSLVPRLVDHVHIEELCLSLEELLGEGPEGVGAGRGAEDGEAGFVRQGRGGVPGLDLVPEDNPDAGGGVFLLYEGDDVGVEMQKLFCAEGADILRGKVLMVMDG